MVFRCVSRIRFTNRRSVSSGQDEVAPVNFIVVLEWLSDPEYASAVESFFGVPGVTRQRAAYCERGAHTANKLVPLKIDNHTLDKLTELNEVDIGLYEELTDCLDGDDEKRYNFPVLDAERFDNTSST